MQERAIQTLFVLSALGALSLLRLASNSHGRQIDTGAATESSKEPFILPELIW